MSVDIFDQKIFFYKFSIDLSKFKGIFFNKKGKVTIPIVDESDNQIGAIHYSYPQKNQQLYIISLFDTNNKLLLKSLLSGKMFKHKYLILDDNEQLVVWSRLSFFSGLTMYDESDNFLLKLKGIIGSKKIVDKNNKEIATFEKKTFRKDLSFGEIIKGKTQTKSILHVIDMSVDRKSLLGFILTYLHILLQPDVADGWISSTD